MADKTKLNIKKVKDYYIYMDKSSILGAGTQATVYLAKRSTDGLTVAAKVFDIKENFTTNDEIYMFSEYCNEGDLLQYIDSRSYISESECLDLFKQIVSALEVLDKNDIAHRDLKMANILLSKGEVKIADFGFAKRIVREEGVKNTYIGSPIFMSPQALVGGDYDLKKSDVWSAGICLYYMLFKTYPFNSMKDDLEELKSIVWKEPLKFPNEQNRSKQVKELISKMLEKDEKQRFNLSQVVNHECLNYSSQKNVNPLLMSSEMNQVVGISQYNSQLRDTALVKNQMQGGNQPQQQQLSLHPSNSMKENDLMQLSEQFSNQKQERKRLIDIHNILLLLATFPQKYSDIWRTIKTCFSRDIFNSYVDTSKKAMMLLLFANFNLSKVQMKELIESSQEVIATAYLKITNHSAEAQSVMKNYFAQENFRCFIQNLKNVYNESEATQEQMKVEINKILQSVGFKSDQITVQSQLVEQIEMALYMTQDLVEICTKAVAEDNKIILNLFANLLIMQSYQKLVSSSEVKFDTYYQLIKQLEKINFLQPKDLLNEITHMYNEFKLSQNSEDEDDEDD